jgi:hypothetical protein
VIPGRRIKRARRGGYELRLPTVERELVASLVGQLRGVLTADGVATDPATRRLFPSAYADDAVRDEEYRELVRDDLLAGRLGALDVVEATVGATSLTEEEVLAWMGAVNDLRLVLGTTLDVSEETDFDVDPSHPDGQALAVYHYLSFLLESIVEALAR